MHNSFSIENPQNLLFLTDDSEEIFFNGLNDKSDCIMPYNPNSDLDSEVNYKPSFCDHKNINEEIIKKEDFIPNNFTPNENTKSTGEKTDNKILYKKKDSIFSIKKVNKLLGRKRKNNKNNKINSHNKKFKDNLIMKIKRNLYNNSLKLINSIISKSSNKKLKKMKLKKIIGKILSVSKKEDNLKLLDITLKQLLSNKITRKFKSLKSNYNEEIINYIFFKNEKKLIYILNKTLREILNIYIEKNVEDSIFKNFKRLKDDIEKYEKNESKEFIDLYEYTAINFEKIINDIDPRKRRKIEK